MIKPELNELHTEALALLTTEWVNFELLGLRFDVLENLAEYGMAERKIIYIYDNNKRLKGNRYQFRLFK